MEQKKNKKVTVIIISVLIVLILLLAITFAFFRTELFGSDQVVKVGTLDLVLDETSEGINLGNAIGISDSEGLSLEGSTFKLINNGNKAVDYIIYLDDNTIGETDTRIDDKYLKYNLNKNGTDSGAKLLTSIGSNPNRILDSGTIEGKSTNEYSLNLWITEEVDGNYSGQVFSGKLRVEVSQARKTVAETLLADSSNNIDTSDPNQTFITGSNPNNYIWYSGKLWRAVSIDPVDNSVKLVTQWNISAIAYDNDSSAFEGSHMESWLNDTTVDGFLGNLREPNKFIKMDSEWYDQETDGTVRPIGTPTIDAVGLLNYYEATAGKGGNTQWNNYLYWVTMTKNDTTSLKSFNNGGVQEANNIQWINSIRPSINLKSEIKVVDGDGSKENPYRLMGDNDTDLQGTKLNTRYSGEYITFGTGDNNIYRIVSHETPFLTKVVSYNALKKDGKYVTMFFNDDSYVDYSINTTIGSFLNGEFLTSGDYLTEEQISMIEDNNIWYLGIVESRQSYKLAKYKDINMSSLTSKTTNTKIGLLRLGELMAGQFHALASGKSNWLITRYTYNGNAYFIANRGGLGAYENQWATGVGVKPVFNLKENVIITGGDGTENNPFTVDLQ